MEKLIETAAEYLSHPAILAGAVVVGSVLAAYLAAFALSRTFGLVARRTQTLIDDDIVAALRQPIFISVLCYGLSWATALLEVPASAHLTVDATLQTLAILVWTRAALRISHLSLEAISRRAKEKSLVQPPTVPVFDIVMKVTIVAVAAYFIFLAWEIDVTAWLASAGIVGIAVGFAAQDTLANLFSGVFIIADAPYKVGDWILLDGGLRGKVTRIGIRSTRILTRDDIEITVPNATIGQSKIVNEAGGPSVQQRIGVTVDAAYGSDIDLVHKVLAECVDADGVAKEPAPEVRFREFGASGLTHELLVWISNPAARGKIKHDLNTAIYKAFAANDIEIPYSKHDVYIKEMPTVVPPATQEKLRSI